MKYLHIPAALALALLGTGCSTTMSSDPNAPTGPPSATVKIEEWQAAYWGSIKEGAGTIDFQGQTHRFRIRGLGAGGTGAQKISSTGQVYNLSRLEDFSGTYTGTRTGFTIIAGKVHSKLSNDKGVVMYLTGKGTGIASSTGIDEMVITLE